MVNDTGKEVETAIANKDQAIENVEKDIEEVKQDILRVEGELTQPRIDGVDVVLLQSKLKFLWKKEEQLRTEKELRLRLLLGAASSERPSKRPRIAASAIEIFVQSAAASYRKWENDCAERSRKVKERQALSNVGEATEKMSRPFLELKSDPLRTFEQKFLLWVRECYTDMKDILLAAAPGERFLILGTDGIGKSMFTVFWICYLATLNQKVLWKLGAEVYLLDFSEEPSVKAYDSLISDDPDIQEVLRDKNAWLVIDGREFKNLIYNCHILLAASMERENYHEFDKNQRVERRFFSVWEEEEVGQFLDEFEHHRLDYADMNVPVRDEALRYFQKLGGVPRYVLCGKKFEQRLQYVESAAGKIRDDTCLEYFYGTFSDEYLYGTFHDGEKSDALVHLKSLDGANGKYSDFTYDFASFEVRHQFKVRFERVSKVDVVEFLKHYANSSVIGSEYGLLFELVARDLLKRGGEFRMKKVTPGGDAKGEEMPRLVVPKPMNAVVFDTLENCRPIQADTYYQPQAGNFQSIDAFFLSGGDAYLLQYFSYRRRVHGFKVKGLQDVDAALRLLNYKICSCVPIDKYEKTGFQPWLTASKESYKGALPAVIQASEQYVIEVDFYKYT